MRKFIINTFIILLLAGSVSTQEVEDIVTDRPDQTESAVTVPRGFFQAELGLTYEVTKGVLGSGQSFKVKSLSIPGVLLRYGILKNVELRLGGEFISEKLEQDLHTITQESADNDQSGLSNLAFGTKIQLFTEKGSRPDAAFIFHLNIPFDTDGPFQSRYIGTDFRFAVAHSLSERFSLSYNLGGEWSGDSPQATGIYTLALGISLTNKISAFAESYGFLTQGEAPDHRLDGGFTYLITKNVQADISGGVGITDSSPDFFIGGGISFRLPK